MVLRTALISLILMVCSASAHDEVSSKIEGRDSVSADISEVPEKDQISAGPSQSKHEARKTEALQPTHEAIVIKPVQHEALEKAAEPTPESIQPQPQPAPKVTVATRQVEQPEKKVATGKRKMQVPTALPSKGGIARELDVYQALATAITQTSVLQETGNDRWRKRDSDTKNIVVTGNRVTMRYTADLYEKECYLAVGPRLKWRTVNGLWASGRVSARSLSSVITILDRNGYRLNSVTISVRDRRQIRVAQDLVRRLRLSGISAINHDPKLGNHASVTFTRVLNH